MTKLKYERPIINKINAGVPDKFGMKTSVETLSHIDTIPIKDIIKEYGSPVFAVSETTIKNTYEEVKSAFTSRYPKVQFAWSYKTNYLNAVCRIYHKLGSWAEVVSGFEYEKALKNGVPGNEIIFNGPDKSDADLELAINNSSLIHIDHFDELYSLLKIADTSKKRPKVAIRVNMDTGIYPQWDRFGFNYENGEAWQALNRLMYSEKVDVVGLHTHIGTYITTPNAYAIAVSKLAELATSLKKKFNHTIQYIDTGGGFASKNTLKGAYLPGKDTCPTFDAYAEAITGALMSADFAPEDLPTLILESGRAMVDDAGYLLGSVIANKRLADGRRSTILDIGINNLFTSFWYEHEVLPVETTTQQTEDTTLYGPLCMNIDVIREAIQFPLLQKGDNVVIRRIGAYNMTQWMQFITYRPNIVLIDTDNKTHIIRKEENNATFEAQEVVPEYLK
jgi:diaminopimelate decarboxylase